MHFCQKKKKMANTTEMKWMFHDTLSNLTKFLHSTEERIYSSLGNFL